MPAALWASLRPPLGGELLQTGFQRGEVHEIVPAVLPAVDPLNGAQTEHEVLAAPLPLGDELRAVDDISPVEDPVDVGVQIPDEGVAPAAKIGVGPGAEADIGPGEPVAEIVPGLEAGLGKVGDLILGIAGPGQAAHRPQIQVGLLVVVRKDLPLGHPAGQGGALLHLQTVAGQVLRDEGQGVLHRDLPAVHGLAGQAVDQIQGQVVEFGLPGQLGGLVGLLWGVDAVDGSQLLRLGGLHPQGQAVDAHLSQGAQGAQVYTVRVTLHGDLCVLLKLKKLVDGGQQLLQALGPVEAGGAAAEIDAVYRDALSQGGRLPQMGQQSLLIVIHPALTSGQGVEIAVVALAAAEWNVDINTKLVPHGSAPRERSFKKFQCIISHLKAERKGRKALRPRRTGDGARYGL